MIGVLEKTKELEGAVSVSETKKGELEKEKETLYELLNLLVH